KLKALGKISAGLAHELNNPASAMVRSAEILYEKLSETPENFKAVMQLAVSAEQTDSVNELIFEKISAQKTAPKDFSLLERQDRVDELMDWMEDYAVENADMIAETLTDFNFETSDLETLLTIAQAEHKLSPILNWFDNRLSVELLVSEIKEASSRVANLVQSVKKYSHMDEGRSKRMTDIHDGLRTTLSILDHQVKQKQIKIDKDFADNLPAIEANAGELNQIWTNLLANAIDAAPQKGGLIKVRTFMDCDYACIEIEDNGSGIPEEIQSRIWEPFFTTKGVGEGTGMGLDMVKKIVARHRGYIGVVSNPGKTVFTVKFLIKQ
ncbi:MAG: ATP-binding protein, partial [Bacteroidota bacterium]